MTRFERKMITKLRIDHGHSKRSFAKVLTVHGDKPVPRQSVIQWENGTCRPNIGTLVLICNTFEVPVSFFLWRHKVIDKLTAWGMSVFVCAVIWGGVARLVYKAIK